MKKWSASCDTGCSTTRAQCYKVGFVSQRQFMLCFTILIQFLSYFDHEIQKYCQDFVFPAVTGTKTGLWPLCHPKYALDTARSSPSLSMRPSHRLTFFHPLASYVALSYVVVSRIFYIIPHYGTSRLYLFSTWNENTNKFNCF